MIHHGLMYKHILAALDGSPRAASVLQDAALMASRTAATLHLCHAVNVPLGLPAGTLSLSSDDLQARLIAHGLQELTMQVDGLQLTAPVLWGERVCRVGRPAQVVVDVAAELHADLIVIGSHGFDVIDRVLGTTAARVVNHARCSVLVVRPPVDHTLAPAD